MRQEIKDLKENKRADVIQTLGSNFNTTKEFLWYLEREWESKKDKSGRQDLNLRPLGPQPSALPDYATPRIRKISLLRYITICAKLNEDYDLV